MSQSAVATRVQHQLAATVGDRSLRGVFVAGWLLAVLLLNNSHVQGQQPVPGDLVGDRPGVYVPPQLLTGYPLPSDRVLASRLESLQTEAAAPTAEPRTDFPTVEVGGFFQGDAVFINQDPLNIATVGDAQNGADFRRARIKAAGEVWENTAYEIEFDFAFPGRPSFMDVYLDLTDLPLGDIRVGHWIQPFGLGPNTSAIEMTFLERALVAAFVPFRQTGIGLFKMREDELATFALTVFRFPTDIFGTNIGDDGGFGMANRYTWLLLSLPEQERYLHLGVGYVLTDPANDVVRYRTTPELFVGETGGAAGIPAGIPRNLPFFVDTGRIPTSLSHLLNFELAGARGPWSAQAEAMFAVVNQQAGSTESLYGAYAQLGYVLTGEHRAYRPSEGAIGRVIPRRAFGKEGRGAWELAARCSYIDLNSGNIAGGRLLDLTWGVNWYLNPHTKFQFNYIHAALTSRQFGSSDADFFAVRAQLDY